MTHLAIRLYTPADRDTLIDLFRQSVRRIARRDYSDAQVLAWAPDVIDAARFAARREAKPTWIAACGEKVAGFTDLEPDGHIDMLFVHPDWVGCGVARELLRTVEISARESAMARLYTEASITAKPVFERYGFTVITPQTVTLNGQDLTNYRMEKLLVTA